MVKSKKPTKTNRYIYVFLTIAAILFLIYNNYDFFNQYQKISETSSKDAISQRLNSLNVDLNNFPRTSVNDIAYLAGMVCTKNLFKENANLQGTDLLEFMEQNSAYYQVILLNPDGNEIKF